MPKSVNGELDISVLIQEITNAEQLTVNYATLQALKKSSGKFTSKKLAKLDYPYSVRHGGNGYIPYGDPSVINHQTWEFYFNWKNNAPKVKGDTITSSVSNATSYSDKLAKGIDGKTIARPLIPSIMKNVDYWRMRFLVKGIANAISKM